MEITQFFNKFGLDNGKRVINHIKRMAKIKNISSRITFKEHYSLTEKKLVIVGTCLTTKSIDHFDYTTYPDMKIMDALRISMSIPVLFNYTEYNKKVYIDGGILQNLPIDLCKDEKYIAINIYNNSHDITTIQGYIMTILLCMLNKIESYNTTGADDNIININGNEAGIIDLGIKKKDKLELFNIGYTASHKFLSKKDS